jgi:release factor glutamine methyltransferase
LLIVDFESILQVLEKVRGRLDRVSETAHLDAQVLLAHVLGRTRTWVMAHPEAMLTPEQQGRLEIALKRLEAGELLPYLLGRWEFYGLEFFVSPAALIPRPETELLVEQALSWLDKNSGRRLAVDVGAGSGCIAVALASKVPDLQVLACDISMEALQVARRNVSCYSLDYRVICIQADLFPAIRGAGSLPGRFDLICANLPYVPSGTLAGLAVSHREPRLALDGGPDGLKVIRRLLALAPIRLATPGLLLIEIEASQGAAVKALSENAFPRAEVALLSDLAGRARLVCVRLKP